MAYAMHGGIQYEYIDAMRAARGADVTDMAPSASLVLTLPENKRVLVRVGDRVLRGQVVAEADGILLHTPEAGFVSETTDAVRIECDGTDETAATVVKTNKRLQDCTREEIIEKLRICGVADSDGSSMAGRLESADGASVLITECIDDIAAASSPASIVNGMKILMFALGVRQGVIVCGDDIIDAAKKLSDICAKSKLIKVATVRAKYPQADKKRLAYAVTGRRAANEFVVSAQTCAAVYDAFVTGMPQTRRIVSVTKGKISKNIRAAIGTSFAELLKFAGIEVGGGDVIVEGGLLCGHSVSPGDSVGKTTRSLAVLASDNVYVRRGADVCIRCGRCVSACPEKLLPNYIVSYIRDGKEHAALSRGALDCDGCGVCSYVCPGGVPVADIITGFAKNHAREAGSEAQNERDKS